MQRVRGNGGFTLIELLVVLALIAISTAAITLSLRDPERGRLERNGERLAALFEKARAEARAGGISVSWSPVQDAKGDQFLFTGLPGSAAMPTRWLEGADVSVQIDGANAVQLGPEPMIGRQRVHLRIGTQEILLATDGLAPFAIVDPADSEAGS